MNKNKVIAGLVFSALLLPLKVSADYIPDNYWGAGVDGTINDGSVTSDPDRSGDVFAQPGSNGAWYDVTGMDVVLNGNNLEVIIHAPDYFARFAGPGDTPIPESDAPGDLFLSTDGWNPDPDNLSTQNYNADNKDNGEAWEYVISLAAIYDRTVHADTASLFAVSEPRIGMGSERTDQEYWYNGEGQYPEATGGTWEYRAVGSNQYNQLFISMTLSDPFMAALGDELGLHWTMGCGNDVIEGALQIPSSPDPVPEPSTMLLFGAGLIGLAGLKRQGRK